MTSATVAPTLWDHEVASCESATSSRPMVAAGVMEGHTRLGKAPVGDGASLDEAITRLWGEVMSHQAVTCPWCEGEMRPRYAAAALPVGGRCTDCGASLS